ncbi:MAG: mechanosensitive ion channel family protein, partial [Saprospiraceae bacterium]|nr:mechanosensitive ion channel family protein [Saprospiraceae bacterium]
MKKALILTLKLLALIALTMLYMGEIDTAPLFAQLKPKYRPAATYYVSVLSALAVFLILLDFVQVTVIWLYRRRVRTVSDDNFVIGIRHLYSIVLVIGLAIGLLSLFQIHIRDVLTSISIIFAGLAILTKDYVSNMINGMILTFSGQISIGDNIRIGEHRGKIIDITLQNIHLINDDDDVIYIPNNTAMNTDIINYTRRPIKRISLDFEIDLKYLNTIEELEQRLIEALQPFSEQIQP